jgi:hypothetical protein
MNQGQTHAGVIVAAITASLIAAGGVAVWVIYPMTDRVAFYIVVAVMVLSPVFVLAAYLVNTKMKVTAAGGNFEMSHMSRCVE